MIAPDSCWVGDQVCIAGGGSNGQCLALAGSPFANARQVDCLSTRIFEDGCWIGNVTECGNVIYSRDRDGKGLGDGVVPAVRGVTVISDGDRDGGSSALMGYRGIGECARGVRACVGDCWVGDQVCIAGGGGNGQCLALTRSSLANARQVDRLSTCIFEDGSGV